MKTTLLMVQCCAAILASGCAAGISRTGYQLPPGQTSKDLPKRPIAIQDNVKYDTNDVVVLGSIHAYDNGFSTDCDEATILDIFCREGNMLGADVIDITQEKQPNPLTSTCYRAKAKFLRFKDREKAKNLVSDAKYAPEAIIERSAKFSNRNNEVIAGAVLGGLLGAIIVEGATDSNNHTNYTNTVQEKNVKKP
jgi:outer membrane lipoprotein SlyB